MALKSKITIEKEYLDWLNEEPREIRQNTDGSLYVPIGIVQEDLFSGYKANTKTEFFGTNVGQHFIFGPGRLHYKHPVSGEWLSQDGQAAVANTGNMALDYPNLGAEVIKNASKKIGRRFGRDLNRDVETGLVIPDRGQAPKELSIADDKILERYRYAESVGDMATMSLLRNAYKIPLVH